MVIFTSIAIHPHDQLYNPLDDGEMVDMNDYGVIVVVITLPAAAY